LTLLLSCIAFMYFVIIHITFEAIPIFIFPCGTTSTFCGGIEPKVESGWNHFTKHMSSESINKYLYLVLEVDWRTLEYVT
jgi:hypothetical protein